MTEQPPRTPDPDIGRSSTTGEPAPGGAPPEQRAPTGAPPPSGGAVAQSPPPGSAGAGPAAAPAAGPGNPAAVVALVLGILALVLVIFTFGVLSFLTLPLGIVAIVLGVLGRRKVERGETFQHRGLATGGLITGAIATVISLIAVIAFFALGAFIGSLDTQQIEQEIQQEP
jgi:hypothetical protein